jgi:phosphoribosylanthranilate isomerase
MRPAARVKICGLTTPETVAAALEGGAGFLGFMFFERSPRNLSVELAARLAAAARGKAMIVAVTVDPDDEALDRITRAKPPHACVKWRSGPAPG